MEVLGEWKGTDRSLQHLAARGYGGDGDTRCKQWVAGFSGGGEGEERHVRGKRGETERHTEAEDVVVSHATTHDMTRTRVILDLPNKPLWVVLNLMDSLVDRHCTPGEMVPLDRRRVQHNSDLT